LELQCLKALWVLGEANVREVRDYLLAERNLAYTTVMTVLDRLVRRGGVQRRKAGRSFIYSPLLNRESLRALAIRELVESYFDGSEDSLRAYLNGGRAHAAAAAEAGTDSRLDASLL
jgi:predicted transcriptional regulator